MKYPQTALLVSTALTAMIPAVGGSALSPMIELETVGVMSNKNQAAWWSPIVHDPTDGRTYLSYLTPTADPDDTNDHVYIAARDADGGWTRADTGGLAYFDVGHTQTSLAMDGDGVLQVFYGMHSNPIKYRVANTPRSVTGGFSYRPQTTPFSGGSFTYPNLTTAPDGSVYMMIRDLRSGGGVGQLYRYDPAAVWSHTVDFAQEAGATVYPDHVMADAAGDLHLIWEWADGGPQATRHLGSYARYEPTSGRFYRADGSAYDAGPITTATADVFQPLEGGETFERGVHGFQSAKMALDDQGRPVVAYAYSTDGTSSGYEHRLARWTGSAWERQTLSPGPFTSDKPWVAFSDGMLRYYTTLSADHELHTGSDDIFLLTSTDLGATWSDPVAVTRGLDIQRPVGTTVDGVDYLYLPSVSGETLYFARVSVPEPSTLLAGGGLFGLLLCRCFRPGRPGGRG